MSHCLGLGLVEDYPWCQQLGCTRCRRGTPELYAHAQCIAVRDSYHVAIDPNECCSGPTKGAVELVDTGGVEANRALDVRAERFCGIIGEGRGMEQAFAGVGGRHPSSVFINSEGEPRTQR